MEMTEREGTRALGILLSVCLFVTVEINLNLESESLVLVLISDLQQISQSL